MFGQRENQLSIVTLQRKAGKDTPRGQKTEGMANAVIWREKSDPCSGSLGNRIGGESSSGTNACKRRARGWGRDQGNVFILLLVLEGVRVLQKSVGAFYGNALLW